MGQHTSHCRDLRRNSFWYSAGAGMADADDSFLKWSLASAICGHDDSSSRDQGAAGLLGVFGSRRSLPFGQLRRISIQHRSAATIFASTCVVVLYWMFLITRVPPSWTPRLEGSR